VPSLRRYAHLVAQSVRSRLLDFFYLEAPATWWAAEAGRASQEFGSRSVASVGPDSSESSKNCTLWCRTIPCTTCGLNIPLSTNFSIVSSRDKPEAALAAFPVVPPQGQNDCTFRIVPRSEWDSCVWPRPGFERWHPTDTPTYADGKGICPRCGQVIDGDDVKTVAQGHEGGLAAQMYAVCSQVPVRLTYQRGDPKVRYLKRFRAPTAADLDAVVAAEAELQRLLPKWEARDLVPNEEVPVVMEDQRPREYGMTRWSNLFLPRQLLTNMVILEEIRAAQDRARAELPEAEAEAVSVYLSLMLSKVISYNSVQCSWHDGRQQIRSAFPGHDFRFHAGFTEMEGARETVAWAASQVISAYDALARLIHGHVLTAADLVDEEAVDEDSDTVSDSGTDEAMDAVPDHSTPSIQGFALRPEVIVPTVSCEDAAAVTTPGPGSVHLVCVDPPYYNNVMYSELSNFFYVWLKRSLRDWPGLDNLFSEPLAESTREAVANARHWQTEARIDLAAWKARYDSAYARLRSEGVRAAQAKITATAAAGPKPPSAKDRADRFYEDKMASIFRRSRQLLHPAGRMVVMFNHKETAAWRSVGMSLIRAGFEVRSSFPVLTEAASGLNIRGLDAARSTILLLCERRDEIEQPAGNWGTVQRRVAIVARGAAERFQHQGLIGTDLYLSALGPALGEVARHWPVTDFAGHEVDLQEALETAYAAVGRWRLEQILAGLTEGPEFAAIDPGFTADSVDHDTQVLWLWLDTFMGDKASSDDVRKLAKALDVEPDEFRRMGLLRVKKENFELQPPQALDLRLLSRRLLGVEATRGRAAREADSWEEREFPGFVGGAVWNAIGLMAGAEGDVRGVEAVRRWMGTSGYGSQREFKGAFAVTLRLLEQVFGKRPAGDVWSDAAREARRVWDLALSGWRA
jgi:putative DNA methylase